MNIGTPIYCCGCKKPVAARLTYGTEIYPRRPDLAWMPFWKCDSCGNYVGCHHKSDKPTTPLGNIPTPELRNARQHIHRILDPLWKDKRGKRRLRSEIYQKIADVLGWPEYHTANLETIEDARTVYAVVREIAATRPEANAS